MTTSPLSGAFWRPGDLPGDVRHLSAQQRLPVSTRKHVKRRHCRALLRHAGRHTGIYTHRRESLVSCYRETTTTPYAGKSRRVFVDVQYAAHLTVECRRRQLRIWPMRKSLSLSVLRANTRRPGSLCRFVAKAERAARWIGLRFRIAPGSSVDDKLRRSTSAIGDDASR